MISSQSNVLHVFGALLAASLAPRAILSQLVQDLRSNVVRRAAFEFAAVPRRRVAVDLRGQSTLDSAAVDWTPSGEVVVTRRRPAEVIVQRGGAVTRRIVAFPDQSRFVRGVNSIVRRDGSLVVWDGVLRVGEFPAGGNTRRQYQLRDTFPLIERQILGEAEGRTLVAFAPYSREADWQQRRLEESTMLGRSVIYRDSLIVLVYDSTGATRTVIGPLLGLTRVVQVVRTSSESGEYLSAQRLRPWSDIRPMAVIFGGGILSVYMDAEREVARYDLNGRLLCRALIDGEVKRGPPSAVAASTVRQLGLLADDVGNVWYETPSDQQGESVWMILGPRCESSGRVAVPRGLRLQRIQGGQAMGLRVEGKAVFAETYQLIRRS